MVDFTIAVFYVGNCRCLKGDLSVALKWLPLNCVASSFYYYQIFVFKLFCSICQLNRAVPLGKDKWPSLEGDCLGRVPVAQLLGITSHLDHLSYICL